MSRCMLLSRTLAPIATLDSAIRIAYDLKHNDLSTAEIQLATTDPVATLCTAFSAIRLWDGERDLGLYRVCASPASDVWSGGTVTYTLEHMLATLLDDVIFEAIDMADVPFGDAIRQLLSLQSDARWVLGDCEFDVPISEAFGGETILAAIKKACGHLQEAYTWHYDTAHVPHVLHIRRADAEAGCGIHYGRSMVGITREMDASGVVTRLYLLGGADKDGKQVDVTGLTEGGVPYIDADTIGDWGIRAAIYQNGDITDPAALLEKGRAILEAKKDPIYTYQATAIDLYLQTGYAWDLYEPGKLVMVTDDDRGIRFAARIVSVAKQDATGDPGSITVTIANQQQDELGTVNTMASMLQNVQDRSIGLSAAYFVAQNKAAGMETLIKQNSEEILLRATWDAHNALGDRMLHAESSLTVQAEGIELLSGRTTSLEGEMTETKAQLRVNNDSIAMLVEKTENIDGRLTTDEASIDILSASIKLKASQEVVDELGNRLSQAEIDIDGANARIDLKASQTSVDELGNRVSAAEIAIDGANARIDLKASQTSVEELGNRVSQAEIDIDGANARIDLKASQTSMDELGNRVSAAEINIDGANARIDLKASQTLVDELGNRVSAAEIAIDGANARIDLKASQTSVDELGTRLSQAEIDIDGANASIALKASKSTVDDLGEKVTAAELRIDGVESKITAQAKTLEAKADLILLDGYVKASELETNILSVVGSAYLESALVGTDLDANSICASSVNTEYISADTITADTITTGGQTIQTATLTIGDKSCTFFAPADATFELSDMPGYDDALAAARTEGASSVYVKSLETSGESYSKTYKTISADLDVELSSNKTSQHLISVDASSAYNAGHGDGAASVTLSAGDWDGTSITVTASNGQSETIDASSVYNNGVSLGANTFYPSSASMSAPTYTSPHSYGFSVSTYNKNGNLVKTFDGFSVDAEAAYNAGYNAAKDQYYDERGTWSDGYEEGAQAGYDTGYAKGAEEVYCDYVSYAYESGTLYVFVMLSNDKGVTMPVDGW